MNWRSFIQANTILFLGGVLSMACHWFAHTEQEIVFTIFGYMSATLTAMFWGVEAGYDLGRGKE